MARYAPSFASMRHEHAFSDVLSAIQSGIEDAHTELGEGNRLGASG